MEVGVRYLPTQDPDEVVRQVRRLPAEVSVTYHLPPATLDPCDPHVRELCRAVGRQGDGQANVVGRDGASDAVFFLERGVAAVEFGPVGSGHHGPEEHVTVESLARYRRILVDFARSVAQRGV
jgi:succinyl-diaminopimelate desuccinylase